MVEIHHAEGRLRFHSLPQTLTATEAAEIRREALKRITGAELEHVSNYSFDDNRVSRRNCENLIGVAQVPLGIVGVVAGLGFTGTSISVLAVYKPILQEHGRVSHLSSV